MGDNCEKEGDRWPGTWGRAPDGQMIPLDDMAKRFAEQQGTPLYFNGGLAGGRPWDKAGTDSIHGREH